jgi:hypothetical protein
MKRRLEKIEEWADGRKIAGIKVILFTSYYLTASGNLVRE